MKTTRRRPAWSLAGLGLALATLGGCQTWIPSAGLTLPSPRYLEHPPQYIPPSPVFPLSRELASQERIAAQAEAAAAPGVPGPLPPPVPAPAGPVPAPGGAPAPLPPPVPLP